MSIPTNAQLILAAKRLHEEEGELEIDYDAKISRASDERGAYVQAWVWVAYDDANQETDQ